VLNRRTCIRTRAGARSCTPDAGWASAAGLVARCALALALLPAGGCSRGAHSGPAVHPADTPEGAASLAARQAWAADLAGRADLGPPRLDELARRGFFDASLCPAEGKAWTLVPGRPLEGYRIVWSCPSCNGSSASEDTLGNARREPAVPDDSEHPWPAKTSPAEDVAREVTDVLARWGDAGHPLGRVRASARATDSLLIVELDAHPGPRVRASGLRFEGNRATRDGYLLRMLGWRGEEPYRSSRWDTARATLLATGLFDDVEGPLLLRPAGTGPQLDSLRAEVGFRLRERRVSSFTGLIGYSGRGGKVSGFVTLELGNLFGTGRRAHVLWQAQRERESRFEFIWHEPYVWKLPLSADLGLTHVLEDTLYAETSWGLDLGMAAGAGWTVKAGWNWRRLVLGGEGGEDRQRETARFGARHNDALGTRAPRGWEVELDLASTHDTGATLHQGLSLVRGWTSARGLMLLVEERAGLVAGPDSVLRGDALSVGGAASLRGYFETAFRATRSLVQRVEVGPLPSRTGARIYALVDVGWLREWRPDASGIFGVGADDLFRWSAGVGLQAPSRAGDLRLDYAVPGGEPVWQGRIHFGVLNRF
jgi:hypothetical protein